MSLHESLLRLVRIGNNDSRLRVREQTPQATHVARLFRGHHDRTRIELAVLVAPDQFCARSPTRSSTQNSSWTQRIKPSTWTLCRGTCSMQHPSTRLCWPGPSLWVSASIMRTIASSIQLIIRMVETSLRSILRALGCVAMARASSLLRFTYL